MGDINIKQLESLRWRMRVIETLTVIGTAWIALAVYQKKEELVYYLVGAVVLLFLLKYYTQFRLRKRQFVSNLVEQRTMELRFQRDAMQAESEKLSRALSALADAQDELVRKERLASIGQLTKGLVDRILNPLNYINNFAHLSAALAKDIKQNIDEDEETGKHDNYNDTQELLVLLTGNLDKIAKHGRMLIRLFSLEHCFYLVIYVFSSKSKFLIQYFIRSGETERFQSPNLTVATYQTLKSDRQTGSQTEDFSF